MSALTKKNNGFTLIELMVATVIMAAVSLVSVQMLWSTVLVRSKQQSIEDSSDDIRQILSKISKNIVSAKKIISVTDYNMQIVDNSDYCHKIYLQSSVIIESNYSDSGCVNIISPTLNLTSVKITNVSENPPVPLFKKESGNNLITITIVGKIKDNLGEHTISAATSAVPRNNL